MDPALPNRVSRTTEIDGDGLLHRFAHGLEIRTDKFLAADPGRVLSLGGPQAALMNYMLSWPERLRGRLVFEPFAGSGAIGLTALTAGARRVELLDVNPRAVRFARENAHRNGFTVEQVVCAEGSIESFVPAGRYDLIFANPPFVPTPDGLAGTLTSNAGSDGNRLVDVLLRRLEELLAPEGEAFVYVFQFVRDGRPVVVNSIERFVTERDVGLTPTQTRPIDAETYFQAYVRVFPAAEPAILRWRTALRDRHGDALLLDHFVLRIGPRRPGPTRWVIEDDLERVYGEGLRLDERELALGRVLENFTP